MLGGIHMLHTRMVIWLRGLADQQIALARG
jgi:hypothetical protein